MSLAPEEHRAAGPEFDCTQKTVTDDFQKDSEEVIDECSQSTATDRRRRPKFVFGNAETLFISLMRCRCRSCAVFGCHLIVFRASDEQDARAWNEHVNDEAKVRVAYMMRPGTAVYRVDDTFIVKRIQDTLAPTHNLVYLSGRLREDLSVREEINQSYLNPSISAN